MAKKNLNLVKVVFFLSVILMSHESSAQSEKKFVNVDQLVDEAIQNNPEVLAAKKRWEVFKEKIPQAYALEDPMFSFGIINLPTNFSFKDEDMTMKEFSLSQKIPFPGKRPLMREMASKEAEAVSTGIQRNNWIAALNFQLSPLSFLLLPMSSVFHTGHASHSLF